MKLICVSDTHGKEQEVTPLIEEYFHKYGKFDVLVHAGDISTKMEMEIFSKFDDWCKSLVESGYVEQVICTLGNHDQPLKYEPDWKFDRSTFKYCKVLLEEEAVIAGYKFYGLPYTRKMIRDDAHADLIRNKIPNDVDVIICHGPPHKWGDELGPWGPEHIGCTRFLKWIRELKPKAFINGHNHTGAGYRKMFIGDRDIAIVNACIFDDDMKLAFDPKVVNLEKL